MRGVVAASKAAYVALLAMLLLLTSCSLQSPQPVAEKVEVIGSVLNGYGLAVANADVKLSSLDGQLRFRVVTDDDGRFELYLPKESYTIRVTAPGYAETKIENWQAGVESLNIRLLPAFYPGWPSQSPDVSLEISGLRYRLAVKSAAPFRAAYLALDAQPGYPFGPPDQVAFDKQPDDGWRWLPQGFLEKARPGSMLRLIVYDYNNDSTSVSVPLGVSGPPAPVSELAPVQGLRAVAVTFPTPLRVLDGKGQQASGQLIVQLSWRRYRWPASAQGRPHGFYVWRCVAADKEIVGVYGGDVQQVYDRTIAGGWNETVKYLVTPFLGAQNAESAQALVKPLPPVTITAIKPENGTVVSSRPTFSWKISQKVGGAQFYYPVLWDHVTGHTAMGLVSSGFTQENLLTFDETSLNPLWPGRSYGFELLLAYAVDNSEHPSAFSIAADRMGQLTGVPVIGPYSLFEVER